MLLINLPLAQKGLISVNLTRSITNLILQIFVSVRNEMMNFLKRNNINQDIHIVQTRINNERKKMKNMIS